MMTLNHTGEIADFVNVSQFHAGLSAFECVAYCAALCKFAGRAGQGPTGTPLDIENTANYWYTKLEGSDSASNTNGMSLDALYTMLGGLGIAWTPCASGMAGVKQSIAEGRPVILCGAETGMWDTAIGAVPYAWKPTGNHAIVVSGIAPDGNLLVRDTANIGPAGLRPDPRTYDASKIQLVSATSVVIPQPISTHQQPSPPVEETMTIDLNNPIVAHYFELASPDGSQWRSRIDVTGQGKYPILKDGMLTFYRSFGGNALCGLTYLGLPLSYEIPLPGGPEGATMQYFERGVLAYDPTHHADNPPGSGAVYLMHLYSGAGQDPRIASLQTQASALQSQVKQLQTQLASTEQDLQTALSATTTALQQELSSAQARIASALAALQ